LRGIAIAVAGSALADGLTNPAKEGAIMFDVFLTDAVRRYQSWAADLAGVVWKGQWDLFEAQFRAGVGLFDTVTGVAGTTAPAAAAPSSPEALEKCAVERARQGLAPPREIYDVANRNRVDWDKLPGWARPADPEMFEGCSHEG
jgi:hypothetical protein